MRSLEEVCTYFSDVAGQTSDRGQIRCTGITLLPSRSRLRILFFNYLMHFAVKARLLGVYASRSGLSLRALQQLP